MYFTETIEIPSFNVIVKLTVSPAFADEIVENIKDDYSSIRTHNIELAVVEDDFLLKEKEDYYSRNFYMKINRSTYEVTKLELGAKYSLAEINNFCDRVVTILKKYGKDFDAVFGVKLETIEDFKKNVVMLLESCIEKRYVIGKIVKSESSWNNSERTDEYGIIFDPSGFLSIEFDDDDKKFNGKSNMKFYCEFDRDTIDPQVLGDFFCKIVDVNKDSIERYIEESKGKKDE